MPTVEKISAREILDSRGRPTVLATCALAGGYTASASVPSGASTGTAEALELRDGDPARYGGLGCRQAVHNVNTKIRNEITGEMFQKQQDFDQALISLDGTVNKAALGANAILAVSVAFARASACMAAIPLWQYFSQLVNLTPSALPRLTINLFSGGKHAGQQIAIQDVLIVPMTATTIDQSLVVAYNVYHSAARLILQRYGMHLLRADEGGLAPPCSGSEEMIATANEAIQLAGYQPGVDVALALDVASTHFYSDGKYDLEGDKLTSQDMIHRINSWVRTYPIISVEDGLFEEDWQGWTALQKTIKDKAFVLGDDLLCTNPDRIQQAIKMKACNALLLKANQIGTLTEAAESYRLAREAGWSVTLSVRSGETEDNWAADLAVGWGSNHFKNGSITQSERLAKYNRLLEIEEQTAFPIIVV